MQLHVRCIDISPHPRSEGYAAHEVEPLAADIRANGVLRPILLRATPRGFVIVHGERRWRAAQMAGLDAIPAYMVQEIGEAQLVGA